jgi:hypothetical protein
MVSQSVLVSPKYAVLLSKWRIRFSFTFSREIANLCISEGERSRTCKDLTEVSGPKYAHDESLLESTPSVPESTPSKLSSLPWKGNDFAGGSLTMMAAGNPVDVTQKVVRCAMGAAKRQFVVQ